MADRRLIITVTREDYKRLAEKGRESVRSPEQQAAYIVRTAPFTKDDRERHLRGSEA